MTRRRLIHTAVALGWGLLVLEVRSTARLLGWTPLADRRTR